MQQTIDQLPAIPPMERHAQIEVDIFCTHCFYNLHGQIVTIDPHLQFPICRCPECGKYHPAGSGITSSSIWMRRLASILLFIWVGLVGTGVIGIALGLFGLSASSVEAFTYYFPVAGTNHWNFRLHPWQADGNPDSNIAGLNTMLWICAGSLALGFVGGMLCVTLLWHWDRQRYFWTLLLPILPTFALAMIYHNVPNYDGIRLAAMLHVLTQSGIQLVGIFVGVLVGRKVSRTIIRLVIPPKPRQMLAFLWTVDAKKLPPGL